MLNLHFAHKDHSDEKINKSIFSILESNTLFSMASVKNNKAGYINAAYYAFGASLNFYFLSLPTTEHSQNLEKNSSVAVSIFDSRQNDPTKNKKGLQIFGNCRFAKKIELIEGFKLYSQRFPSILKYIKKPRDFLKKIIQSRLYIIKPQTIKVFDEATFGEEVWVTVSLPK